MRFQRLAFFTLIVIWLAGCVGPVANFSILPAGSAAAVAPGAKIAMSTPAYILAGSDATPTPTPFQPIPPTPIISQEDLPTATPEPQATATPQPAPDESQEQALDVLAGQVNILLLGADARPWSSNFRTDTIILVTLNPQLETVNVTSFPRDLYVTVPGWGMQRINSAWPYGGWKLLRQTFEHNFGVRVDYYALLKFSSFKQIIDSLGGLDIHVSQKLSDYRAGYWVTIPAGEVQMDADTVLWYVRSRKTTNDFARNQRQQEVLQALFRKLVSMNALRRVPELYDYYQDGFLTNIDLTDMLAWLPLAAKVADNPDSIQYLAIKSGQVSNYITPYGAMVLLPNRQKVMNTVRKSQNLK
jgi:LCP family protein required for cell wall assembly